MTDDTEDLDPPDGNSYELVLPFVVALDGKAFAAGIQFQQLWQRLEVGRPDLLSEYVYPELVEQLDLLAMHFGYTMTEEPWDEHPEEWTLATFTVDREGLPD